MKRIEFEEYAEAAEETGASIRHRNRRQAEITRTRSALRHRSARQRRATDSPSS